MSFFYLLAPIAPAIGNVTNVTVTEPFAGIYLWPVEQRNGPIRCFLGHVVQNPEIYVFY